MSNCCAADSDLGCRLQSGEQITALDDLQDIDELHVTEVSAVIPNTQHSTITGQLGGLTTCAFWGFPLKLTVYTTCQISRISDAAKHTFCVEWKVASI